MRVPSGSTDRYVYFVAVDPDDLKSRETGLSGWTVYASLNGGTAGAFTTPTVNETDSSNMPGVYELLLDEYTSLTGGHDAEELCLHITHASMQPVTRVIEIYRPETTEGTTLSVAGGAINSLGTGVITAGTLATDAITAAKIADNAITNDQLATTAVTEIVAGVWNALRSSYNSAGSFGEGAASVQGNVTGSVGSVTGAVGSVTGAVGSVTGSVGSIDTGGITSGSFAAGAIDSSAVATGAIDADAIASSAITDAKIATGAITNAKFAAGAIDASAIAASAIADTKIATGAITSAKFAAGAIDSSAIATAAIDADAIASSAITDAKIATGAITSDKLAAGAITATVIATGAVDADALATDAVDEIADGVWNEVIETAHETDGTAGEHLNALAKDILARTNTQTLHGLLGIADSAGNDLPAQVLTGETCSELSQGVPVTTPTVAQALMLLYMALRNKVDVDASYKEVHNNAGTVICKKGLSDDSTTYSEAKMVSGP